MANTVYDDELAATEAWLGCAFPEALKALWADQGSGLVPASGDVILGPFDVVNLVDATRHGASPTAFPFLRGPTGTTFSMDVHGHVLDHSGAPVADNATSFLDGRAVTPAQEAGGLKRVLRGLAGAFSHRETQAGA